MVFSKGCNRDWALGSVQPNATNCVDYDHDFLLQTQKFPFHKHFPNEFITHVCHETWTTVFLTATNKLYSYGSRGNVPWPNVHMEDNPFLMYNGTNDHDYIKEIQCVSNVIFKKESGKIFGVGRNSVGGLCVGQGYGRVSVPMELADSVIHYSMNTDNVMYSDGNENVYSCGTNTKRLLGDEAIDIGEHRPDGFGLIDMSVIENEGEKIQFLHYSSFSGFIIFRTKIYGWGKESHLMNGNEGVSPSPILVCHDNLPSGMIIVDFLCHQLFPCLLLGHESGQKNKVYSYGFNGVPPGEFVDAEFHLGRFISGNNWLFPVEIMTGEIPPEEEIVSIGSTAYASFVITNKNVMYAWGGNVYTFFFQQIGFLSHSTSPKKILSLSDISNATIDMNEVLKAEKIMEFHYGILIYHSCFGINDVDLTCSGHGHCIDNDVCLCRNNYYLQDCSFDMITFLIITPIAICVCVLLSCIIVTLIIIFIVVMKIWKGGRVFGKKVIQSEVFDSELSMYDSESFFEKKFKQNKVIKFEDEKVNDPNMAKFTMNLKLFNINWSEITLIEQIGKGGGGGTLFVGLWLENKIVCKIFKTQYFDGEHDYSEFENELEVMASIRHPNIIRFYGCSIKNPRLGIVLELCEHGDLQRFIYIRSKKYKPICFQEKMKLLIGVANALNYLHSNNIIHRDIKPQNILVSKDMKAKLIDFGLSKFVEKKNQKKTGQIGTSHYMSPQVFLCKDYTELCDVFSFGITCYEVVTENFMPYKGIIPDGTLVELVVSQDPSVRPIFSKELIEKFEIQKYFMDSCKKMWSDEEGGRPSFKEILEVFNSNDSMKSV